ncbi:MAG TPA: BACON domain-containing carbohydrate-binding protein [Bryobacteraceae bacterium]|nr:BACON domain-containing carbohydrate-binding protein [Bryobacteraceae bacterium]
MLILFRLVSVRFLSVAALALLSVLGSFDTAQGQTLTLSTNTLSFTAAQGNNPSPPFQTVSVGSTGAAINYKISSDQTWLLASACQFCGDGGTSGPNEPLTIQVTSSSLNAGNYTGHITLTPTNGSPTATITVTLTVTGNGPATSTLVASLSQLNFSFQVAQAGPASQGVQITATGINIPISSVTTNTAPTNNCPSGWLQASSSSGSTPATITVSVVTSGLTPGTCTGAVSVNSTSPGNGSTSVQIGVTLYVSTSPLLNVAIPAGITSVTLQKGANPVQFAVPLTSSDPSVPLNFTANTAPGSDNAWLAVSPVTGSTPASLNVQVTPNQTLAPGNYTGSITIASSALLNGQLTIPITFNLTSPSAVTVTPSGTQNFNQSQGGSPPAPITLTLTSTSSATFTTSVTQQSGGLWLQATPSSGSVTQSTPGTVTLTVLPNTLGQGTYSSLVTISFQSSGISPITIPVSLSVGPPVSTLVPSPSSLTFTYLTSGSAPAAQNVSITNLAGSAIAYTVGSISQSWLSVTPSSGTTPGSISVSVTPQSLAPGSYTGSFTLSSPSAPSVVFNVTLNVTQSAVPQVFIIGNAASGVGGQLAPGEIITIKGSQLGPATPQSFTLDSLKQPTLGGVGVTFSGIPGTLLYVSSSQINVTVPYEVAGTASTNIVVTYNGVSSAVFTQQVASAALGLFTNNSTGTGQASILNQNYTYNTATTPAAQGSYISLYATGGGQTIPASTTGEVSPNSLLPLVLSPYVTATIGGKNAPVVFSGAAPGYVTGVVQFNIQVPTGVSGTALPIIVTINGANAVQSQSGATVSVQ